MLSIGIVTGAAIIAAHVAILVASCLGRRGEELFLDWVRPARMAAFGWLMGAALSALSGCTHQAHVRAVNTAAVTLETTAEALLSEYERGRPEGDASAYAERWVPVLHALSAAYAAHDGWRVLVERGADEASILAAASRAREALCELQRVARGLASIGAVCGLHTVGSGSRAGDHKLGRGATPAWGLA